MFFHFDCKKAQKEKKPPRFLVLRRKWLTLGAAALAAAAIFPAVNYPAAVNASAATRQLPIYCVQRDQKVCSISFDAAWGADNTQKILDVLKEYGVTCTFFVVGNWADQYPEQAKAIVDSGNELMNHSNAHDHFNSLTADQIIADVNTCNDKIEALTGVRPTLIRCPFGEYDDHVISAIRSMGKGGWPMGIMAMDMSLTGLSSAATRLELSAPHRRQRWMIAHSPFFRTHTATGSISPPQSDSRSPGSMSKCTEHRQLGQWFRWSLPAPAGTTG
ncbi:MAG TPA: hypothetical protein DDY81_09885 [Clostridiales bacterium]|nr:hypothetical protein [Clostridiales bacterium]